MRLAIDSIPIEFAPDSIDIVPDQPQETQLSGGGIVLVGKMCPLSTITLNYEGIKSQDWLKELQKRRGNDPIHMISFEDTAKDRFVHINAHISNLAQNSAGYTSGECLSIGNFSVTCKQLDIHPTPVLLDFLWGGALPGNNNIILQTFIMPCAGIIIDIDGYLRTLGGGGGVTIHRPTWTGSAWSGSTAVASGLFSGNWLSSPSPDGLSNAVIYKTTNRFYKGDCLYLTSSAGGGAADMHVVVTALMFRA